MICIYILPSSFTTHHPNVISYCPFQGRYHAVFECKVRRAGVDNEPRFLAAVERKRFHPLLADGGYGNQPSFSRSCEEGAQASATVFRLPLSLQQNIKHAVNVLMPSPLSPSSSIFPIPVQVCIRSQGEFRETAIKGYVRMRNKTISKEDHYYEAYPRLALC